MKPLRFSTQFGVVRTVDDDWFDPTLGEDTQLYVDPFLIFLDKSSGWGNAHDTLMRFFINVIGLLNAAGDNEADPRFQKAKTLLLFKEPPEFCLGTSKGSIFGAGSNKGLQVGMLEGAREAIRLGLEDLRHFEELALFGEQIGADRISDITCDVLKPELIAYTQDVAKRHGIKLEKVNVGTAGWDESLMVWKPGLVDLPVNPIASALKGRNIGVILVPERFLRRMPNIDPQDFWDFACSTEATALRGDLNVEIGRRVHAAEVAKAARQHRRLLRAYLDKREAEPKPAYDVVEDPELVVHKGDFGSEIVQQFTMPTPSNEDEFQAFVEKMIENFKFCVEQRGSWHLLWADGKPRAEKHVQYLFQATAVGMCQDHDVDMSPEANAGRGPVDFKMSKGWHMRALLEVKLAKSSTFRQNLKNQTPVYAKAEGCSRGYFIVIQFTDKDCDPTFMNDVDAMAEKVAEKEGIAFKVVFVDARPPLSASKVKD
jgi:hypothetical protein